MTDHAASAAYIHGTSSWRLSVFAEGWLYECNNTRATGSEVVVYEAPGGAIRVSLRASLVLDEARGSIGAIKQSFDGEPLYPSAQVRTAHLLYFLIKGYSFGDGNKRIGTLLFLHYLRLQRPVDACRW